MGLCEAVLVNDFSQSGQMNKADRTGTCLIYKTGSVIDKSLTTLVNVSLCWKKSKCAINVYLIFCGDSCLI